jgi:HSP20 family molecular chaperone IbpA
MKPIWKNTLLSVIGVLVGAVAVVAALRLSPTIRSKIAGESTNGQKQELVYDDNQFNDFFKDKILGQSDPFEEMRKMRQQMEKNMTGPFDSWFSHKFGGGSVNDITQREDDKFVYYDVKVPDVNSTSIKTKVENGYITITGTVEKKNESSQGESFYKSSFNRTFPLPDHVDENKMQMSSENNEIVLKFPKLKS